MNGLKKVPVEWIFKTVQVERNFKKGPVEWFKKDQLNGLKKGPIEEVKRGTS